MLIPNAHRAFIDPRKLAEYSLSAGHPVGGHKAILFERIPGLTSDDAQVLGTILIFVVRNASASPSVLDEFGQRYIIDFTLRTEKGSACLRSAWIIRSTEDFPRLTTCFVLKG